MTIKFSKKPEHSDANGEGKSKSIGKGKHATKTVRKVAPRSPKVKKA